MKKRLIILIPITTFLLFISQDSIIAKEVDFSVYPSKVFISTRNTTPIDQNLTITNNSSIDLAIKIEKRSFTTNRDGSIKLISSTPKDLEIFSNNISILDGTEEINTLTIDQKTSKNIKIEINNTDNISEDDLIFGLLLTSTSSDHEIDPPQNTVVARSDIRSGFFIPFVITHLAHKKEININSFTTPPINTTGTPSFDISLTNPSSHAISSKNTLLVTDIFGNISQNITIDNKILLANSSSQSFISNNNKPLLPGIYKATLKTSIKSTTTTMTKANYFFVVQIRELVMLSLTAFLLLFLVYRLKIKRRLK